MKSVDIAFPVYKGNLEEIQVTIPKVYAFCDKHLKGYNWHLVLGVNGWGAEKVLALARDLEKKYKKLGHCYTETPGKGAGLKKAWEQSKADIVSYMDIDLSVDMKDLPTLLKGVETHDICVGSRYHSGSSVHRSFLRRFVSWFYHHIIQQFFLETRCEDLHCGFKAFRSSVAKKLLPHVQDPGWYFDSEIMSLAERLGYSIKTIPVLWTEGQVSGLSLRRVIPAFLLKTVEMKMRPLPEYLRKK
ncbi:MAG: glycosyltransferase [Nanoarchaeota archaeon]